MGYTISGIIKSGILRIIFLVKKIMSYNPNQLLRYSFRANANAPLICRVKEEKKVMYVMYA